MARCCLSAIWLVHGFLDEAHAICQDVPTTSGSLWHAIMHRREGDFSNAKYWLRRVRKHPAFLPLGQRVAEVVAAADGNRAANGLIPGDTFDPFAFVDLVEHAVRGGRAASDELCLDVQQAEWEILFDWCYRRAFGNGNRQ
jgi:hypothetical protein